MVLTLNATLLSQCYLLRVHNIYTRLAVHIVLLLLLVIKLSIEHIISLRIAVGNMELVTDLVF